MKVSLKIILGIALLLFLLPAMGIMWSSLTGGKDNAPENPLTARVERGDLQVLVVGNGLVEPAREKDIVSQVSGTVKALDIYPGREVEAGDTLVRISVEDMQTMLENARLDMEIQEMELQDLKEKEENLAEDHRRQINLLEQQVEEARLEYKLAQREVDRLQEEYEKREAGKEAENQEVKIEETGLEIPTWESPMDGVDEFDSWEDLWKLWEEFDKEFDPEDLEEVEEPPQHDRAKEDLDDVELQLELVRARLQRDAMGWEWEEKKDELEKKRENGFSLEEHRLRQQIKEQESVWEQSLRELHDLEDKQQNQEKNRVVCAPYDGVLQFAEEYSGQDAMPRMPQENMLEEGWPSAESIPRPDLPQGTAPQTNGISPENLSEGDEINRGAYLATLVKCSRLQLTIPVDEVDINRVEEGQRSYVTAAALPGKELQGEVTGIANVGTGRGGVSTFDVTVEPDNTSGLRPGMNVHVEILVEERSHVLTVPIEAVTEQHGENVVWASTDEEKEAEIKTEQGKFKPVSVETGVHGDTCIEIKDGLQEGQEIVIRSEALFKEDTTGSAPGGLPFVNGAFGRW